MASSIFSVSGHHWISKWICRMAQLFGYWPFEIDAMTEYPPKKIISNTWHFIWITIMVLIYVISIYGRWTTMHLYRFMGFSSLEFIIDTLTVAGFGLVSILTATLTLWNRHEMIKFIRIIRKFDQMVWLSVVICNYNI